MLLLRNRRASSATKGGRAKSSSNLVREASPNRSTLKVMSPRVSCLLLPPPPLLFLFFLLLPAAPGMVDGSTGGSPCTSQPLMEAKMEGGSEAASGPSSSAASAPALASAGVAPSSHEGEDEEEDEDEEEAG